MKLLLHVPRTRAANIHIMREIATLRGEKFVEPEPLPSGDSEN
jgi:hypothetical protein